MRPCRGTWGPRCAWGPLAGLCSPGFAAQPAGAALAELWKYRVQLQAWVRGNHLSSSAWDSQETAESSRQPRTGRCLSVRPHKCLTAQLVACAGLMPPELRALGCSLLELRAFLGCFLGIQPQRSQLHLHEPSADCCQPSLGTVSESTSTAPARRRRTGSATGGGGAPTRP